MINKLIKQTLAICVAMVALSSNVWSMEHEIVQEITISGENQRVVISPFQLAPLTENYSATDPEYTMYEINYNELKRQIKIYQQIYVTGQLLHGYLMVKMKPKFVD